MTTSELNKNKHKHTESIYTNYRIWKQSRSLSLIEHEGDFIVLKYNKNGTGSNLIDTSRCRFKLMHYFG